MKDRTDDDRSLPAERFPEEAVEMRFIRTAVLGILACAMLAAPQGAEAATLQINGSGILTGATGVEVNGTFYDVTFTDDSCFVAFNECNSISDFDFATQPDATAATQALINQIFGSGDSFDTNAALTFGCNYPLNCAVMVPFATNGSIYDVAVVWNNSGVTADTTDLFIGVSVTQGLASSSGDNVVLADFTPTAVPEPASLLLLGSGLVAVTAKARCRRKQRV